LKDFGTAIKRLTWLVYPNLNTVALDHMARINFIEAITDN